MRNSPGIRPAARATGVWALLLLLLLPPLAGCIELGLIPPPNGNGQDNDNTNGNGNDNDGDPQEVPAVRLVASNVTPQVNEELILRCELLNDPGGAITYQFQASGSASQRFQVDPIAGTARFIVEEVDVGVALSVACTATNSLGTSPPSNSQVIVASPSTTPDPIQP